VTDDALKALSAELYEAAGSTKPISQDALVKADLIVRKFLLSRRLFRETGGAIRTTATAIWAGAPTRSATARTTRSRRRCSEVVHD
jgi:ribosomal protein S14